MQIIKRWGTKEQIKGKFTIKRGEDQIWSQFLARTNREEEERRREEEAEDEEEEEEGGVKKGKELCMILYGTCVETMILYGKVMGISLSQT